MKALCLCGGLGTRLRPLTNKVPKCMVDIAGKPCLERIVDYLEGYGITEVMINTHWLKEPIMEHFGNRLIYSYEPELLGTAGTIHRLLPWLGKHFLVLNGDTLREFDLKELLKEYLDKEPPILEVVSSITGHKTGLMVVNGEETKNWWPEKGMIDNVLAHKHFTFTTDKPYFDIGTLEKLKRVRKIYEG